VQTREVRCKAMIEPAPIGRRPPPTSLAFRKIVESGNSAFAYSSEAHEGFFQKILIFFQKGCYGEKPEDAARFFDFNCFMVRALATKESV